MNKKLVHISPTIPPSSNGLGDFCDLTSKNFRKRGINNQYFLVRFFDANTTNYNNIQKFDTSTLYGYLKDAAPDVILLNYVNYAYHSNGIPFYLAKSLKCYKQNFGVKILVFFHELYSSSKSPFNFAFYTNFFQKKVVKQLASTADVTFTNAEMYHKLLKRLLPREQFKDICLGVFSNISDELYNPSVIKIEGSMVVFGSFRRRLAVISSPEFIKVIEMLKIKLIVDIGPGKINFEYPNLKFCTKGNLPAMEVSKYLNYCMFGAIHYIPQLLGKSGIFSAYAAFGIIPINMVVSDKPLYDGLIEGTNYFNINSVPKNKLDFSKIKLSMNNWYEKRSQNSVSDVIFSYI